MANNAKVFAILQMHEPDMEPQCLRGAFGRGQLLQSVRDARTREGEMLSSVVTEVYR
jgi:hypothetical protein